MWVDPDIDRGRINRTLRGSHEVSCRVELWSEGRPVSLAAPFIDGSITDEWVNGSRRHISITVPPNRLWMGWLDKPQLEIRPYRGIQLSKADLWECPMGRFPIHYPEVSRPISALTLQADDYWQQVESAQFTHPTRIPAGTVMNAVRWLLSSAGLPQATAPDGIGPTEPVKRAMLDKSRHEAAMELARAHDFEVFIDRQGYPVVRDPRVLENPYTSVILPGEGLVSYKVTPDWNRVFNVVSVTSSAQGVSFPPQIAAITDPQHPASPYTLGTRNHPSYRVLDWVSPLLQNAQQGKRAAGTLLRKASGRAVTYSYDAIPDPSRDAGDTVLATHRPGSQTRFQMQSITTPLSADGVQSIKTISTQQDYT